MSPATKPPKRGRPALPKSDVRAVVLQTRVQPSERKAYQRAADMAGISLSDWVRQVLNAEISK